MGLAILRDYAQSLICAVKPKVISQESNYIINAILVYTKSFKLGAT